jgi:hypothetical protein
MLGDPTPLFFVTIFFGVVAFIFIMFLPAFLELKKPRDLEAKRTGESLVSDKREVQLASIERSEEIETDLALIERMSTVLSALPNLEA